MTAAERAHDHLCDVLEPFCEWGWTSRAADRAVASLMADPALLVDLAIEAGGLERCVIDGIHWEFFGEPAFSRKPAPSRPTGEDR